MAGSPRIRQRGFAGAQESVRLRAGVGEQGLLIIYNFKKGFANANLMPNPLIPVSRS